MSWDKNSCIDVFVDSWCGLFLYTRLPFAIKRAAFWVCVCINLFVLHSPLGFVTQEAVCGCGALHRLLIALITEGYLVALQCCTSSAYISFYVVVHFAFCVAQMSSRISSATKLWPDASALACFHLHLVWEINLCGKNRDLRVSSSERPLYLRCQ